MQKKMYRLTLILSKLNNKKKKHINIIISVVFRNFFFLKFLTVIETYNIHLMGARFLDWSPNSELG